MRTISLFFGVCVAAGLFAGARPAAADLAPVGLCAPAKVGQACDQAVNEAGDVVGAGVCVAEKCSRATPNGPMTYDCVMCRAEPEPGAGGAGGASNEAGAAGTPAEPTAGGSDNAPRPSAGNGGNGGNVSPTTGGNTSSAGKSGTTDTPKTESSDDGGCSIGLGARGTGLASAASLLVLGLALRRRRSQPRAR